VVSGLLIDYIRAHDDSHECNPVYRELSERGCQRLQEALGLAVDEKTLPLPQSPAAALPPDGTLRITSQAFPLDRFTGQLINDRVEADFVWHDLRKDELNRQTCIFERFTPFGTPGDAART
jgi:hypothetical protein